MGFLDKLGHIIYQEPQSSLDYKEKLRAAKVEEAQKQQALDAVSAAQKFREMQDARDYKDTQDLNEQSNVRSGNFTPNPGLPAVNAMTEKTIAGIKPPVGTPMQSVKGLIAAKAAPQDPATDSESSPMATPPLTPNTISPGGYANNAPLPPATTMAPPPPQNAPSSPPASQAPPPAADVVKGLFGAGAPPVLPNPELTPQTHPSGLSTPDGKYHVNSKDELDAAKIAESQREIAATTKEYKTPEKYKDIYGPTFQGPASATPAMIDQMFKGLDTDSKELSVSDPEMAKALHLPVGTKVSAQVYDVGVKAMASKDPTLLQFAVKAAQGDPDAIKVMGMMKPGPQEKQAPHSLVFEPNPDGSGGFVAKDVGPGDAISATSRTASGINADNTESGAVRSRSVQAGAVLAAGDELIADIKSHSKAIGNLKSYWHQYTNGTPIADPEISGLMAQIASFAALQPALHGFRGSSALKEFEGIIGGVPKSPEAMISAIQGIQKTAKIVKDTAKPGSSSAPSSVPEVSSQAEFDKLPKGAVYTEGGKQYRKP